MAYTRFKADKGTMDALVHLRKQTGRGETITGEPALTTSQWGMLYADDVGVVSQSPKQRRNMMNEIMVVCVALSLIV